MNRLEKAVEIMDLMDMEPMLLLGSTEETNDYADAFVGVDMNDSKAI